MKKTLKWLVAIVLVPIALFLLFVVLLYLPPVQNWAVRKVAAHASMATGMKISVEKVSLSFPLDLQIEGVMALQQNDSICDKIDTVADVKRMVASVQLLPLLHRKVEVDELTFDHLKTNTADFIGDLRIKGNLERLHLVSHNIDIAGDSVKINIADIRGGWIDIALGDTTKQDSNKEKTLWKINIDKLNLSNTHFALHLPGDSMAVAAQFKQATAHDAHLLLHDNIYKVGGLDWNGGTLHYDRPYEPRSKESFDSNHMAFSDIHLGIDSFLYAQPKISLSVRAANMKEQSGLTIEEFSGPFFMDDKTLSLSKVHLKAPNTLLDGSFSMSLNTFSDHFPRRLNATLKGYIAKADIQPFLSAMPKHIYRALPDKRIALSGQLQGNLQRASFRNLHLSMPGYFNFTGTGRVENIVGKAPFKSNFNLTGRAENLQFAKAMLPADIRNTLNFPNGIGIKGHFDLRKDFYGGKILLTENRGKANVNFAYSPVSDIYKVNVSAVNLALQKFLPNQGLHPFSGSITAHGKGTDIMSGKSSLNLTADIRKFRYRSYVLDGITGKISKHGEQMSAAIRSSNRMVGGNFTYKGIFKENLIDGHLRGNLSRIDLKALGVMTEPYVVSAWTDADVRTNMDNKHSFNGPLKNFRLTLEGKRGSTLLAKGDVKVKASVAGSSVTSFIKGRIDDANLRALDVIDKNYYMGTNADILFASNFKDQYLVSGKVDNFTLAEHHAKSVTPLVQGNFDVDVTMKGRQTGGHLQGNLVKANLYQLGIVDNPMSTQGHLNVDFATNGDDELRLKGLLGNVVVDENNRCYTPGDVKIDIEGTKYSTRAVVDAGDFHLNTALEGSVNRLEKAFTNIGATIKKQIANKRIDQPAIVKLLPRGHFQLKSGGSNFFSKLLEQKGYSFSKADIDLMSSPDKGLDGVIKLDTLLYNKVQLDKVLINLTSANGTLSYQASIENEPTNSYPYKAYLQGEVYEHGLNTHLSVIDNKGKKGIDMALQGAMQGEGLRFSIISPKSILGYKEFSVNDSNYVYMGRDRRIRANLELIAADKTGIQIRSENEDTTSLQNLTFSVHRFELGNLFTLLPFVPRMSGILNGDYHLLQTDTNLSVSTDMAVQNFVYENNRLGNVNLQGVYMPKGEDEHYVDVIFGKDEVQVGNLVGTYSSVGEGNLDATFNMDNFPLNVVNTMIPNGVIGLKGTGNGELTVKGPLNKLDINGKVSAENGSVISNLYGIDMHFGKEPLIVDHSKISFNDYKVFDEKNTPLHISGYFDFTNTDRMLLDASLNTKNFLLINARENPRAEAYGKAYIDFVGRIRGDLDHLRLGGRLDVLGATNMTYVVQDATLASDTSLKDLVQFTDFNDSTEDKIERRSDFTGFEMGLLVNIDEQAHILCALDANKTNYIDLIGGGNLTLNYDALNGTRIRGKYTLNDGEMKYSMQVIPLRTFTIQNGSYLEFTGDPMAPILNITATEDIRASVSNGSGSGRLVDFKCGVKLTKQFPKPSVEFIISAPEDQEIQNALNTKSVEERSKLAVTMLASGLYLDGDNMSSANTAMNGALAGFLQTQINTITGRALSSMGLDISANMETAADVNGSLHTDYTFKFAKRLWNNRLRIIMGGRVSTGSNLSRDNGAFFDNFSLEYRLNQNETKYLKLYYEREAYDWLEGDLSEFGVGFMWRRKLRHFKDIFRFKKDAVPTPVPKTEQKKDTLVNFVNDGK